MVGESAGQSCYRATWWRFTVSAAPGATSMWAGLTQCFSSRRNDSSPQQCTGWLPSLVFLPMVFRGPQVRTLSFLLTLLPPSPDLILQLCSHWPSCLPQGLCISFLLFRKPFSSIFSRLAPSHCSPCSSNELPAGRFSLVSLSIAVSISSHSPHYS